MIDNLDVTEDVSKQIQAVLDAVLLQNGIRSVILFGSTANGTRNKNSDLDILITVDNTCSQLNEISIKIRMDLWQKIHLPIDLIVEREEDFLKRKILPTLERKIAREGRVLYVA
jgi:predicted nucleotidyltransferase